MHHQFIITCYSQNWNHNTVSSLVTMISRIYLKRDLAGLD